MSESVLLQHCLLRRGYFAQASPPAVFDLTNRNISEVLPDAFRASGPHQRVLSLSLRGNRLTKLPEGLFRDLLDQELDMGIVDMSYNELTALSPNIFQSGSSRVVRIQELHLEANALSSLPAGVFRGLYVYQLHLEDNNLTQLHAESFRGDDEEMEEAALSLHRDRLKRMLKQTRERIANQQTEFEAMERGRRGRGFGGEDFALGGMDEGDWSGGAGRKATRSAPPVKRIGAVMTPGKASPLALMDQGGSSGHGASGLVKSLHKKRDANSQLLAQAVQQAGERRDRKSHKSRSRGLLRALSKAVGKKRSSRNKKSKTTRKRGSGVKPDPDGSDYPDEGSESSSYRQSDSEVSCEPPLRKKAARRPGSVMEMLARHAQDQLDRGSLAEDGLRREDALTGGVKIGAYFALLIRPYFPSGSPFLRELYALAQAIDLLRAGLLPECADALAARFVAVHTALSEGNWTTASYLEMYPLEPVANDVGGAASSSNRTQESRVRSQHIEVMVQPRRQRTEELAMARDEKAITRTRARTKAGEKTKTVGKPRERTLGKQQGRCDQGEMRELDPRLPLEGQEVRRADPLHPPMNSNKLECLMAAASQCSSMRQVGRALLWLLVRARELGSEGKGSELLWTTVMSRAPKVAMHRGRGSSSRPIFPLPVGQASTMLDYAKKLTFQDFCNRAGGATEDAEAWQAVTIAALNGVAGHSRALLETAPDKMQSMATASIQASVNRALGDRATLDRSPADAEKELSGRFLSYTGEEVPKMQVISLKHALPALPPSSHSGSIDALDLLSPGSKEFLLRPEDSLLDDVPWDTPLKAKVHIKKGEELELALKLVERKICVWTPREDILRINNQLVLNGMFAVGKGRFQDDGGETQRLIMNLVPTNRVCRHAQGATADLPGITQYLSLVLDGSDKVMFYQSDMSAAFYLFRIPHAWTRVMSFNISFRGDEIGLGSTGYYHLSCAVIPMGWESSVSIMQEIADRLTVLGSLPDTHKIRRTAPLPPWLVESLTVARSQEKAWYHVYLDNFCAMHRGVDDQDEWSGAEMHRPLENAWVRSGILSSAKKRVVGEPKVQELGALIDDGRKTIGGSALRILKLIQSTLVVISKPRLRQKWVQVLVGRWVHLFSFRRPAMVVLDEVWKFHSASRGDLVNFAKVRAELFGCCLLAMLLQADLSAKVSEVTTASDASLSGGAVGVARSLSEAGRQFVQADLQPVQGGRKVLVLVVSLFNGIGCTFRCYDLCGIQPMVGVSFEFPKKLTGCVRDGGRGYSSMERFKI
eukprot:Skav224627  [mRNA]  locus=scaffold1903:51756:62319:+ [translate_table: standard]